MSLMSFFGLGGTNHTKSPDDIFFDDESDGDGDSEDSSDEAPYTRPGRAAALSKSSRIPSTKTLASSTLASVPKLRAELQEAAKNVPKYLFRMWHKGSGHDSRLNSVVKVIPHAFFHKKGHKSVYEMTYDQFLNNATAHVTGQRAPLSEFSSWSQSPYFAFNYAMHAKRMRHGNIHVAIIDAEALIASNPAVNVAVLHKIFKQAFAPNYHEEYLVHGIIQGSFYKAVPFDQLCSAGLLTHLPSITQSKSPLTMGGLTRPLPRGQKPFEINDLKELMKIAHLYGANFTIPFAITLFCCRKSPKLWSTLTLHDLQRLVGILGGWNKILEVWGKSQNVLYDGTYPKGYEANKQMIRVMRALTHFCWGLAANYGASAPLNKNIMSPTSLVSVADEENITSGMSTVRVSPPDGVVAHGTNIPPPSEHLPDPDQQSRKRPREEPVSQFHDTPMSKVIHAYRIPPSRISSSCARHTGDYHESNMRIADSAIRSLWTRCRPFAQEKSVSWLATEYSLVAIWGDNKITDIQSREKFGAVEFFRWFKGDGSLWFARVAADFPLKVNDQMFNKQHDYVVGPLPPFSIWEIGEDLAFIHAGKSGLEYMAVPDHEHSDGRAIKRQKQ